MRRINRKVAKVTEVEIADQHRGAARATKCGRFGNFTVMRLTRVAGRVYHAIRGDDCGERKKTQREITPLES